MRIWTVGVAARGTSGRNTREQKADSLNTTGPYSLIRHPMYLANGIIVMGLALFPHTWLLPPAVAALTLAYYTLIAWREEEFLRARFGHAWEEWAERVPRLWPHFSRFVPAARPWHWREALRREYHGLTMWTMVACASVAFYLAVRLLAKRTRRLRFRPS